MTNAGYGFNVAPTVGVGIVTATATGGTFTTVATAPTARVALYNLTTSFFGPAAAPVVQGEDAAIPSNRKINNLSLAGNGLGMNITSNLTLFGTTSLTLAASANGTGNILDLGGNSLICTLSTYLGAASTIGATNTFIRNGSMVLTTRGGLATLNYPYSGTVILVTGSGTLGAGSSATRISVSPTAAPTGTVDLGVITGNRGYRIVRNAGSIYGTNPTVALGYNSSDALVATNPTIFIAQAVALTGPWTVRSLTSGTGTLTLPGSRTTAITAPGPIVMTGDDYFGFASTAAAYISAQNGNWETPATWVGSTVPPISCDRDVFINHTVTTTATGNFATNLTINAAGTLIVGLGSDLIVGCSPTARNNTLLNRGILTVSGGTLNINGNLDIISAAIFNQSGGSIIVDGNDNGNVATSVATATPLVSFNSHLGTVSAGNLTIVDPPAPASAAVTFSINTPSASFKWDAAHNTNFGNGSSTDASANVNGFVLDGWVGSFPSLVGSVTVNAGSNNNRWLTTATVSTNGALINGNLTINSGSEVRGGSIAPLFIAGNIVNNGTLTTQTAPISFLTVTSGNFASPSLAQSVSGSGVFRNLVTSSTHNFTSLIMNNANGVTFASNNVTASGGLTVNGTSVINVASGKNLTLGSIVTVTAPATLTFESNSNLIQTAAGTNVGNITVRRNTAMQRLAYTFWGSPVAAQNLLAFSPLTTITRFSTYSEPTGAFVAVAPGSTNFVAGQGYSIRAPNTFLDSPALAQAFTGTFTGVPNNGTITVIGTRTSAILGDNLVGNPYPCTISTSSFFTANTNIGTLYFWTKSNLAAATGNNYASQTNAASTAAVAGGIAPNGFIQVGQGFFCNFPTTAATITFNNGMKVGNNADQFYRNANIIEKHIIKLNLTSPTSNFNQIAIGYVTDATSGVDAQIDGPTFNGGDNMQTMISSLINGSNYVIQGKGLPFSTTDEFALGFKTDAAGSYTLSTESFDGLFANGQDFFIKDNLTGTTHNIKQTPYNFVSAAGTFNSRFQLVYQAVLNVSNPSIENGLIAFVKNDRINIRSTVNMTEIKVYDLSGRLVYEKSKINTKDIELNDLKTEHQMLLIQITADGKTVTKKIVY